MVFALGSIARKPCIVGEEIKIREYLSMTVLFDHDVTDGAPVVSFIQRFKELLEKSYGLNEYIKIQSFRHALYFLYRILVEIVQAILIE